MDKKTILKKISENQQELSTFGVSAIYLFGSVARGEANESSDVDLFVEFNSPVGILSFVRLKLHLESLIGMKVDLVARDALRPELKERIEEEAIRAA